MQIANYLGGEVGEYCGRIHNLLSPWLLSFVTEWEPIDFSISGGYLPIHKVSRGPGAEMCINQYQSV